MRLPSGTVTFLFTDIGDSTRLWEEHPDVMAATLGRHDAILQRCVERHGGLVVKSTGDGVMAVFADATPAVAAAIEGQVDLESERWPVPIAVRMGLHTGPARAVGGDYHAPAVNRAARVAAVAHPGQILATAASSALAESFSYVDLGDHALKGLAPMRLVQVELPGRTRVFPPLPTSAPVSPGLPVTFTAFVGRDTQIEAVCELVREHRVVTVTGVGGCGKTRLAIEVATRLAEEFGDGVRFVDLAPVTDDAGVAAAVTSALGLVEDPSADPVQRLARYLSCRALLLVLDNCEHVLDGCAELVEAVIALGATRMLATSREPLAVEGERVLVVRSLDIDGEAIPLFVDRASTVRPGFTADESNRTDIAEICRRLDGMPLAIELAAAQMAHLSVSQIRQHLDDRFRLLVGGRRRVQRQQTLGATLDWSHQLLDLDEQVALRRLAAFPSSFTLEAAEAVTGLEDTLRVVASLASKSLIDVIEDGDRFRYRLLETVRIYAQDRLVAAGESAECRDRLRDWVVDWLESMPLDVRWLGDPDVLDAERPAISAALEWSATSGDGVALARIASGVDWTRGGSTGEGTRWCERAASTPGLPRPLELQVLTNQMVMQVTSLDPGAVRWAERAIEFAGDEPSALLAVVLSWRSATRAVRALQSGVPEDAWSAVHEAERAMAMGERYEPSWQMYCRFVAGMTRATLATVDPISFEWAESHYSTSTEQTTPDPLFRSLRASLFEYQALFCLLGGRAEEALEIARDAPSECGRWPMFGQNGSAARILALEATGAHQEAMSGLSAMADSFRRNDVPFGRQTVCVYAGAIAAISQEWERSAILLGAGREGIRAGAEAGLVYVHHRDLTRAALGSSRARRLRDQGVSLDPEEALEIAFAS